MATFENYKNAYANAKMTRSADGILEVTFPGFRLSVVQTLGCIWSMHTEVPGGLASGFLNSSTVRKVSGARFSF
jgi:hypothetical protein